MLGVGLQANNLILEKSMLTKLLMNLESMDKTATTTATIYGLRSWTWNVRTLYKPGADRDMIRDIARCKIEVASFQETRWQGSGIRDTKTHTILYSNKEGGNRELGVAFIAKGDHDEIQHYRFQSSLQQDMHPPNKNKIFNLTFINAHGPTEC